MLSIQKETSLTQHFNSFIDFVQTTEATKDTYTREIRQFLAYLADNGITEPTRADIVNYVQHLKDKGLKPTTVQNYTMAVKQLFNWLEVEFGFRNIAKGIKGAKVSKAHKKDNFSMEQVAQILKALDCDTETGARAYAIILLMTTTALRTIEVHRADIDDIRSIDGKFYLYVQGKGHSEKDTPVQLTEGSYKAITHYLSYRTAVKGTDPLFTSTSNNSKGKRISTRTLSSMLKDCFRQVGYNSPRLTAHSLRHTGITEAYKAMKAQGVADTLTEVQKYARHANPATSQIYIHEEEQKNNLGASLVGKLLDNALGGI